MVEERLPVCGNDAGLLNNMVGTLPSSETALQMGSGNGS